MRDLALDFELKLQSLTSEECTAHEWGRSFLSPGLPLVWDANWILIEQAGMSPLEVAAAADRALEKFAHRTVAIRDEADGERLAAELGALPGWSAERTIYMAWQGETARDAAVETRETTLAGCESLRRAQVRAEFPPGMERLEETTEQLLESNRRLGAIGGDRWFLAPAQEAGAACRLLTNGGIGQIEDVITLAAARRRGLGQAVVLAALAASRRAGNGLTFLAADADDWPREMYEKLGFVPCGVLTTLRRTPT